MISGTAVAASGDHLSELVTVGDPANALDVPSRSEQAAEGKRYCENLERGNLVFFPRSPIEISPETQEFLRGLHHAGSRLHKNVAYRPGQDRLTGISSGNRGEAEKLRGILREYSNGAAEFLSKFVSPYASRWRLDFASFRPFEEEGRDLRQRARNDLLHTDAFPTRPTGGDRILRFFTNLNPSKPRVWVTGETFEALAERLGAKAGLPTAPSSKMAEVISRGRCALARTLGLREFARPPYDDFMVRFHNFLKENQEFQTAALRRRWEFPPGSSWMVFTDMVSHAVLSGQWALEQTFLVEKKAMLLPERCPLRIVERLAGHSLPDR